MSHLLDTNICANHFRRPAGPRTASSSRAADCSFRPWCSPSCMRGLIMSPTRYLCFRRSGISFKTSTSWRSTRTVPSNSERSEGGLLQRGISVPVMDLMIASAALVHDLTLVTHNTADFRNIPGLRLDDWLVP